METTFAFFMRVTSSYGICLKKRGGGGNEVTPSPHKKKTVRKFFQVNVSFLRRKLL